MKTTSILNLNNVALSSAPSTPSAPPGLLPKTIYCHLNHLLGVRIISHSLCFLFHIFLGAFHGILLFFVANLALFIFFSFELVFAQNFFIYLFGGFRILMEHFL